MFRTSTTAKIDPKGRLKMPARFRTLLAQEFGGELFLTSIQGKEIRIYPMQEWLQIEGKIRDHGKKMDPRIQRFLRRVNYFGEMAEMDSQGRVLIPQALRDHAGASGEVVVLGNPQNYLEIWNHEHYLSEMEENPLTDSDLDYLSENLGI